MLVLVDKVVFHPQGHAGSSIGRIKKCEFEKIVSHICIHFTLNIMRFHSYIGIFAILVILLTCIAGCTQSSSQTAAPKSDTSPQVPGNPLISGTSPAPASTQTARSAGIDTTIDIHSGDFNCLDVQKELGVDYLYPDQKYRIWATSPGNGQESVNVLFIDVSDRDRIQTSPPVWDAVKKSWIYEGLVPIVQFNDVTVPRETTITIKKQGKYYLCADDRKGSMINDAMLRVPVKLTRI
jgi:hypothetical protein